MYHVKFHWDFAPEWKELHTALKELVGEVLDRLEEDGPSLGRPDIDTLSGSNYANMKEIRIRFGRQVWRFAFAFDHTRSAIILCGGEKQGANQSLFYRKLIRKADARFDSWLRENSYEH